MSAVDPVGAGPETRRSSFIWLLAGVSAAPVFWIGQIVLSYCVSALTCFAGDSPRLQESGSLTAILIAFDIIALLAAASGGLISFAAWRRTRDEEGGGVRAAMHVGEGRSRFLALWGMLTSLWFFFAILFNAIASVMVPACGG